MPVELGDGAGAPSPPPLELTPEGARFLEAWEGVVLHWYADVRGIATIGVGHAESPQGPIRPAMEQAGFVVVPGIITGAGGRITLAEALELEQRDVDSNAIVVLKQTLKVPVDPAQIDSLCDVGFNCGPDSLSIGGAIMTAVNSKPLTAPVGSPELAAWHQRVSAAMMLWDNPRVLVRRRESDGHLFATGQYSVAEGNVDSNF